MIYKFLNKIDIYGEKIELNFNKKAIHNTTFGGFLTLSVIIFFALGFWFSAKDLITRGSPTVISGEISVDTPQRVPLNQQNITLMVQVADIQGNSVYDPSIINVFAIQEIIYSNFDPLSNNTVQNTTIQQISMELCNLNSIGNQGIQSYFSQLQFESMFCFSNNSGDLFLEGDVDSAIFSQVYIHIQLCQNSTKQSTCQPSQQINNKLKSSKINIFMSDQFFDPYSFNEPLKFKGTNKQILTSSQLPQEIQISFMNQYVQDDVGIMLDDYQVRNGFFLDDIRSQVIYTEDNILARLLLRMQNDKKFFVTRRYLKITDVVGQLGGLLKILVTAGAILSAPFVRLHLQKEIINEIFNFKFVQETKQKTGSKSEKSKPKKKSQLSPDRRSKKTLFSAQNEEQKGSPDNKENKSSHFMRGRSKSNQKAMNLSISVENQHEIKSAKLRRAGTQLQQELQSCCSDSNYKIKKRKTIIEAAKTIFVVTKSIINYGFIDYIVHFLFPSAKSIHRKKTLVDQSIGRIFEHLDVLFILNKMLEIEKLKKILLNEDQLRLFEFIPKPEIEEEKLKDLLGVGAPDAQNNSNSQQSPIINLRKIEIVENGKIQDSEIQAKKYLDNKNLYDLYSHQKSAAEKALDAYQGLVNILKKEKKSDRDNKLIELIDPQILEQYQHQIQELEKKNMLQSIPISITKHHISGMEQSNEDINASVSFNNQLTKFSSKHQQHNSAQNILYHSNKHITKDSKYMINHEKQVNSDFLSSTLSIPQETSTNKGQQQNQRELQLLECPQFKSVKDLNLQKLSSRGSLPLKRKGSFDESLQLSTILSQQTKQQSEFMDKKEYD